MVVGQGHIPVLRPMSVSESPPMDQHQQLWPGLVLCDSSLVTAAVRHITVRHRTLGSDNLGIVNTYSDMDL